MQGLQWVYTARTQRGVSTTSVAPHPTPVSAVGEATGVWEVHTQRTHPKLSDGGEGGGSTNGPPGWMGPPWSCGILGERSRSSSMAT